MDLSKKIRDIKDFPKEGIIFRDITTLLKDPEALKESVDMMQEKLKGKDFDIIVGPESRGFIFGMPIAYNLSKGFVPIRKKGKLPAETIQKEYSLEYGTATIEMHKDAVLKNQRVVIVDDLLATGGTSKAIAELLESVGAKIVSIVFLIELEDLKGRDCLKGYDISSIVKY